MTKSGMLTALLTALGFGLAFPCSFLPSQIYFDTISPGVVQTVEISEQYNFITKETSYRTDTIAVSRYADFKAKMEADLRDSALVFLGRIDTIVWDSAFIPSPMIDLRSSEDFPGLPFVARVRVESLFKGIVPAKTFWVKALLPGHSCQYMWRVGRTFLNVSNGLVKDTDIKMPLFDPGPRGSYIPFAHWFDGRYLVSPGFPGLRLDITDLYPEYPATSLRPRDQVRVPLRGEGKAYLPDGRTAPFDESSRRKAPLPLLR